MVRFFATDIDGTLYDPNHKVVPNKNYEQLIELQKQGVIVCLASARCLLGMKDMADKLELSKYNGYVIASNGAEIVEMKTNHHLASKPLSLDRVRRLYEYAIQQDLDFYIEQQSFALCTDDNPCIDYNKEHLELPVKIDKDILSLVVDPIYKCAFALKSVEQRSKIDAIINTFKDEFHIVRATEDFIDIVEKDVHKASAIEYLLHLHNISKDEAAAIGDGYNDLVMIQLAKYSATLEDGKDILKEHVKYVVGKCEDGGVSEFADILLKEIKAQ